LLDTKVLIRWVTEPKKLSREQKRVLEGLEDRQQAFGVSAMTLIELAVIQGNGGKKIRGDVGQIIQLLENNPLCRILPISPEIAREVAKLGTVLRDPADRTIVATARIHGLALLTADQLIVESRLVSVID
jgi:PIN domain nuclease of toxin-antitoxin system